MNVDHYTLFRLLKNLTRLLSCVGRQVFGNNYNIDSSMPKYIFIVQ